MGRPEERVAPVNLLQVDGRIRAVEHDRERQARILPHVAHFDRTEHPLVERPVLGPDQRETGSGGEIFRRHDRNTKCQERQRRISQRRVVIGGETRRVDKALPLVEQRPLLDEGQSFIDPSRFTADYDASLAYPALPFLTLRIAVMATEYFAATACLALVRPEHGPFYKRVFGAVEMSDVREYPGLAFPVVLYSSNSTINLQQIYRRYPFFRSTHDEQVGLRKDL